jgi:hypothetical protein
VDLIYNEVQAKLSLKEYEADLIEIRKRFESFAKEVGLKANIKDVCVLADSKPSNYHFIQTSMTSITLSARSTKLSAGR